MDTAQIAGALLHRERYAIAAEATEIIRADSSAHPPGGLAPDGELFDGVMHDISKLFISIVSGRPAIFRKYVEWQRSVQVSRSVPLATVRRQTEILREVVERTLPPEHHAAIAPVFDAGFDAFASILVPPTPLIDPAAPHGAVAQRYLETVLAGRPDAAIALIERMVDEGLPVADAYRWVIRPAQQEIGRRWQVNEVSVAEEHRVTETSRTLMARLRTRFAPQRRRETRIVTACLGGELHDLGARMVSDFLTLAGFESIFTGANTPHRQIVETVATTGAAVVALSATMTLQVRLAYELIDEIRAAFGERVRVLVGGYAFDQNRGLWRDVGADAYAASADGAVEQVESLSRVGGPLIVSRSRS